MQDGRPATGGFRRAVPLLQFAAELADRSPDETRRCRGGSVDDQPEGPETIAIEISGIQHILHHRGHHQRHGDVLPLHQLAEALWREVIEEDTLPAGEDVSAGEDDIRTPEARYAVEQDVLVP